MNNVNFVILKHNIINRIHHIVHLVQQSIVVLFNLPV